MRRPAIVLLALALGACASGSTGPQASDTPTDEPPEQAVVYYLQAYEGRTFVVPERHEVPAATPAGLAQETATGTPLDPDLFSAYPPDAEVLSVTDDADGLTVDWNAAVLGADVDEAAAIMGIQQVLWTLGGARVRFTVEGETEGEASNGRDIAAFWGHFPINDPTVFRMLDDVEAPITIDEPAEGDQVPTGKFTARGEATVFEATVGIRVREGSEVIFDAFTTASEGAPGRGSWDYEFLFREPGTFVIEAFESSAEDGRDAFVQTRTIVVTS